MSNLKKHSEKTFEEIKHINEFGNEYWLAKDLALVLEYTQWRNFLGVVEKAMEACATVVLTLVTILLVSAKWLT